jgi:hypothetical protein
MRGFDATLSNRCHPIKMWEQQFYVWQLPGSLFPQAGKKRYETSIFLPLESKGYLLYEYGFHTLVHM